MRNQLESDALNQTSGIGVNFVDIAKISLQNWKGILLGFFLGAMLSTLYCLRLTDKYQAVALIKMLTLPGISNESVEQPQVLIARMKIPTMYDQSLIGSCGLTASSYRETLSTGIEFTLPKGTVYMVELTLTDPSEIVVANCMSKIVDMIDRSQFKIIHAKVKDVREKISRLNLAKTALERRISSESSSIDPDQKMNFVRAQFYSKIMDIDEKISDLEGSIEDALQVRTTLVEPIYVSSNMKFNGAKLKIFFLMFLGILIGFLGSLMMSMNSKKIN